MVSLRDGFEILLAVNFDGAAGEVAGACTAGAVDVFVHFVAGCVHLPQTVENLIGAVVVVVTDVLLKLGDQLLRLGAAGSPWRN